MTPYPTPERGDIVTGIAAPDDGIAKRTRGEYLEMPGLRLKLEQAQRLFGVEPAVCRRVLDELVAEKFLCVKPDGAYARLTDGVPSPRPVKAALTAPDRSREVA